MPAHPSSVPAHPSSVPAHPSSVPENDPVTIRDARPDDWDAIWPFFHEIVSAGETYAYDRGTDYEAGRRLWMIGPPGRTVVATDADGTVVGTSNMYANRPGGGSHVASASFMVDQSRAGRGTGRALGEEVVAWARRSGFRAIQFNAVVETNERAIGLWRSLGFDVVGTVPEAFEHPDRGYVGLLIMHRFL
jgi:L-amino acid N-acyltransferase YncA